MLTVSGELILCKSASLLFRPPRTAQIHCGDCGGFEELSKSPILQHASLARRRQCFTQQDLLTIETWIRHFQSDDVCKFEFEVRAHAEQRIFLLHQKICI